MKTIIVITGTSSGFGASTARALAKADHTVYASMHENKGCNAPQVEEAKKFVKDNDVIYVLSNWTFRRRNLVMQRSRRSLRSRRAI